MAENKKSFVLYADLLKSIEHLTNEEKGILFNHLLLYVNDKNPILEDRLILTAWKPIELQLKRDLMKFEEVKEKRSNAGKRSAQLRALQNVEQNSTNPTSVESVQHRSTNPTDNVNDNVNDNVINKKGNTKAKPFVPPTLFEVVEYFKENNFTEQLAERAFKYYDVADWRDSKGNQVKNWKQKMQSVWFKDENKVQQPSQQIKWTDPSQIDLNDNDWASKLPTPPQDRMSKEYREFCEKWRTRELKEAQFKRVGYYDQI